ncbi:hypothetical protein QQX09_08015 [Demequina sp. SYSU T00192]|uniref:Uncharacterized protein n=1 Tax=Demequina litoralis TaxID=3051660 RepID=A0ABT8G9I0_9MICO|nr:hypothetical protein [Demequina sp. SYSU T00192]MDN4475800.1 hypothetical protein [Demequina sp. SYSU T00192]
MADQSHGPALEVVAQIEHYLSTDRSRVGDVFRLRAEGLDADQIAVRLGVRTSRFVWNNDRLIAFLLEGDVPSAPTVASYCASKCAAMLRSGEWSPATRRYLELIRQQAAARF